MNELEFKYSNIPQWQDWLKKNCKDIGVEYEGFSANVMDALNQGGAVNTNATCKLMAFEFLYFLLSIKDDQMQALITDMSYLAQKKNTKHFDTFGPFIKIS